jgi:hypothetical protein
MKQGFYLSPCGKHIIELIRSGKTWDNNIVFNKHGHGWFYLSKPKVEIMLSAWIPLE